VERPDGRWACHEFGLVVPRQNGKGSCLEARELFGLFVLGERLLVHSAHEQSTSSEHFRRLLTLIEGVPEFDRRVLKAPKGKGAEAIELRGGQRIFFKTRTVDGGRGLSGDFVALDEAMKLRLATMAALVPTMAARSIEGNPQMVYSGSAVDGQKDEHGDVLARVRRRAISGDAGRLGYHEYSCEGDDPGMVPEEVASDPERWAEANPGMGIRISAEYIADERRALDPRSFAVERLGIGDWPELDGASQRVISKDAWDAGFDPGSQTTGLVAFGFDVTPDRSAGAIAVAGWRPDGLPHVEIVRHQNGAGWLVAAASELLSKHANVGIGCDARGPAASLVAKFVAGGVEVRQSSTSEYAQACGQIYDEISQDRLRHLLTPELSAAVAGAAKRSLGDAWAWSRRTSGVDISPLVAATLALWVLTSQKASSDWYLL
jgi:hypothetical protein